MKAEKKIFPVRIPPFSTYPILILSIDWISPELQRHNWSKNKNMFSGGGVRKLQKWESFFSELILFTFQINLCFFPQLFSTPLTFRKSFTNFTPFTKSTICCLQWIDNVPICWQIWDARFQCIVLKYSVYYMIVMLNWESSCHCKFNGYMIVNIMQSFSTANLSTWGPCAHKYQT